MKERFEFTDGSHYEFDPWSKADLARINIVHMDYWYMQLVTDAQVKQAEAERERAAGEKLYFIVNPMASVGFKETYNSYWDVPQAYKRGKDIASDVLGIGITYNGKPVINMEDAPHDMYQGVYLPVRYSPYIFGNLYIDPTCIVNKVLYEPSIVPKGFIKLLNSKA